jgi:anti-sigma factor RsiW
MQLEDRSACVTDFGFDEWFAGEGSAAERARVEGHVRACTRCGVRGELLERERTMFLNKAPTLAANAELARKGQARRGVARRLGAPGWLGLLGIALVGAFAAQLGTSASSRAPSAASAVRAARR